MSAMHCFSLTTENHIAHLVLNRAEALNTMGPRFWGELDTVLTDLHKNNAARALVISSTGKHFSAGMALDAFAGSVQMDDQSPEGRAAIFDSLSAMQATFTKLETLRIPVIAALQGGVIGGAVDMVTACCIRYGSKVIALSAKSNAVECANYDELTAALATIRTAVEAGELDAQIETASTKLRDGFRK